MTTIGTLRPVRDLKGDYLAGCIKTLDIDLQIKLYALDAPGGENAPSHRIHAIKGEGDEVEIGAAWAKSMTAPDRFGEEFLSISIDDPSLAHPLNVAAFKEKDSDAYAIVFRRRQHRNASEVKG